MDPVSEFYKFMYFNFRSILAEKSDDAYLRVIDVFDIMYDLEEQWQLNGPLYKLWMEDMECLDDNED